MKKIFTILAILSVSAFYAQSSYRMVLIPDYPEDYEYRLNERIDSTDLRVHNTTILPTSTRRSNDLFVIGNFNRTVIIQNHIHVPEPTVDNNNYEYIKTTQFNPDKTLQEILRNE